MIFLESISGSLSRLFLLLLSLFCPAPLSGQCPTPGLCSRVLTCLRAASSLGRGGWLAVLQSFPLSCVLPWSLSAAQSPAVLRCPFPGRN